MSQVTVYTTDYCPYCTRAKNLLQQKGIAFEEKMLQSRQEIDDLKAKTGMMTVPQIFIGDELVGGFTELSALDQEGKLDHLA